MSYDEINPIPDENPKKSFFQKHKKLIITTGVITTLGLGIIGIKYLLKDSTTTHLSTVSEKILKPIEPVIQEISELPFKEIPHQLRSPPGSPAEIH